MFLMFNLKKKENTNNHSKENINPFGKTKKKIE